MGLAKLTLFVPRRKTPGLEKSYSNWGATKILVTGEARFKPATRSEARFFQAVCERLIPKKKSRCSQPKLLSSAISDLMNRRSGS